MEKNQMKNIVILKNLPSNLVEEAIVIFKSNKYAKKFEYIDKNENINKNNSEKNPKDYIIREAEMIISNCLNKIEKKDKKNIEKNNKIINKRLKMFKIYSITMTIAFIIALMK